MNIGNISGELTPGQFLPKSAASSQAGGGDFARLLDAGTAERSGGAGEAPPMEVLRCYMPHPTVNMPQVAASSGEAAAAYQKQQAQAPESCQLTDWQKYKDDQLLSNPGGDNYYLDENRVDPDPKEQDSFWGRLKKDVSDAFSNARNFVSNLLFGSKIHYRDEKGQIREDTQRGLVGSVVDFFKDLGSALSFGSWRPDGEAEPEGFGKRVGFFFSKMKEAIFGDLVQGVTGSVVHMAEDVLFAGWNLLETVPDATIGNFKAGKKAVTAFFDTGQVILDYLTDIVPGGDGWVRVHSANLTEGRPPILLNLDSEEHESTDTRWKYVRNTPLRKGLETFGSIFTDILSLRIFGHVKFFSDERHHRP
ncbi:MAG: hypothetical protein JW821_06195 [Deltaproteobacteria bacterium]|nr:hypothetical protein [Deltaproteobacteria bacterium]